MARRLEPFKKEREELFGSLQGRLSFLFGLWFFMNSYKSSSTPVSLLFRLDDRQIKEQRLLFISTHFVI